MKNSQRFYTYAYLREDRTPYYIGKGSGKRIYSKQKYIKPPKDKSRIIYLKQNITEEEAFKHEIYMIDVFGRKDLETGILHNRTGGGEGTSGYNHTEQCKELIRSLKKGKCLTLEHKKKLSMIRKDRKWWNDGSIEKKFYDYPGKDWFPGRLKNEEIKIKYGKSNIGRKPTKEFLEKNLKRFLKYNYTIKSPDGKIYTTNNMKEFSKIYNLTSRLMTSVAQGKYKQHKGWTVVSVDELSQNPPGKSFDLL